MSGYFSATAKLVTSDRSRGIQMQGLSEVLYEDLIRRPFIKEYAEVEIIARADKLVVEMVGQDLWSSMLYISSL